MGGRQPGHGHAQLTPNPVRAAAGSRGSAGAPERHWAEALAERHLVAKGFAVLERNYRLRGAEIDLVVKAPDATVVFVEVRQRSATAYGGPAASISPAKQRRVRQAARHYLATVLGDANVAVRFDAVLVTGPRPTARLQHLEDAF